MAFLADFECQSCHTFFEDVMFSSFKDFAKNKLNQKCSCGKILSHVLVKAPSTIIAETNDPISAKPTSYWRNAENVAQRDRNERIKAQKEKDFYT